MKKLERLTQEGYHTFLNEKRERVQGPISIGPVITELTETLIPPAKIIENMQKRDSPSVPKIANAYVISEYNGSTNHIRIIEGREKQFTVYAIQFYLMSD